MTFLQIEYFIEIVKCGSFTKAAEKLFVSHQSLSVQMKALEKELGIPLFDRSNRKKQALTESGEVLFTAWTNMLNLNREAIQKAKNSYARQFHTLRIGVQNVPYIRDVTLQKIEGYVEKNNMNVEFLVDDPEMMLEKLNAGELDLCSLISFTLMNAEGYHIEEIGKKRSYPVIAISKDNPLSKKKKLTLQDIRNETILTMDEKFARDVAIRIKEDFAQAGITDIRIRTMRTVQEVKMAVLMNQGVTIILNLAMMDVLDKVKLFEFKKMDEEEQAKIVMVWKDPKWNQI